jgi:preprotein translocase subunit SecA
MTSTNLMTRLKRFRERLNGSITVYDITQYAGTISAIRSRQRDLRGVSDDALRVTSRSLIDRARCEDMTDDLLVPVFALAAEAARRVLLIDVFDEQLVAGIVMHQGGLAQMQTGEGKTLAAVFPACLNALAGKGVHVLTFNDYLARRDAQWMGPVYVMMGLRVGVVQQGMAGSDRRDAYRADITYLTAKEAGFDLLRDNLCDDPADIVHREFCYAIIDEADSILIDEARIPLIIAGVDDCKTDGVVDLYAIAGLVEKLVAGSDFDFDDYKRAVHFTEHGLDRIEDLLHCGNLFAEHNGELLSRLSFALHALHLLQIDDDYIVRHGVVELVDENTGRVADKRRWPEGLQAAVEAKERCAIQSHGRILNSMLLHHFIMRYPKNCGMTATAQIAEEEFREFYGLGIVVIAPHTACQRIDHPDRIFCTKERKLAALVDEIITVHAARRPILVGTRTIEESAQLAQLLQQRGVGCEVLNAKRDEFEAGIIAQAGSLGAVTIATNMAGRGTDIRLGGADGKEHQAVVALGGLYVIATNRHESRRIDNQLRGRAGRQGDPGSSRFFVSLEDDLFVKYRLSELLPPGVAKTAQDAVIDNPIVRMEIDRSQRIVEAQNLEIKITLSKYAFLLERQRSILSERREAILFDDAAGALFNVHAPDRLSAIEAAFGREAARSLCRKIALATVDYHWSHYLQAISDIREGIHLRRIGGQNPLQEFHRIIIELFTTLEQNVANETLEAFRRIPVSGDIDTIGAAARKPPGATWTYLINDNPFDPMLETELKHNIGFSVFAGLQWPVLLLYFFVKKLRKNRAAAKQGAT